MPVTDAASRAAWRAKVAAAEKPVEPVAAPPAKKKPPTRKPGGGAAKASEK